MTPILVPALKTPVAIVRSFLGNHSETVLTDEGKIDASPSPKRNRMMDMDAILEANEARNPGCAPKATFLARDLAWFPIYLSNTRSLEIQGVRGFEGPIDIPHQLLESSDV